MSYQTIQLLFTSPLTVTDMVLGKFLSAVFFVLFMLFFTLAYPAFLIAYSNPEIGTIVTSYLGTFLLSMCYVSIGVFFSAITENQIVSGVLTLTSGLFFWLISWAAQSAGPVWSDVLEYLSLINHYNNFSQGLIDSSDVIYCLSFAGIFLFLSQRVLDSYRWR
jgi:ABC-2 type transport system permease protein